MFNSQYSSKSKKSKKISTNSKEEKIEKCRNNKSMVKNKLKQMNVSYQNNNNINMKEKMTKNKYLKINKISNKDKKHLFFKKFNTIKINNFIQNKNIENIFCPNEIENKNQVNQKKNLNKLSIQPKNKATINKTYINESNNFETINYTDHTINSNLDKMNNSIIKKLNTNKGKVRKYKSKIKIKKNINNKTKIMSNNILNTDHIFSSLDKKKELKKRINNIKEIRPVSFSKNKKLYNAINRYNKTKIGYFKENKKKVFNQSNNNFEKFSEEKMHIGILASNCVDLKSKGK